LRLDRPELRQRYRGVVVSCEKCPCPTTCLQRPSFCEWAQEGKQSKLDHIRMRSALGESPGASSFPPVATQIGNALGALGRAAGAAVSGQFVWVPAEVRDARRAQCMTCEHLVNDRCKLCGCFFAKKIRLATEACPDKPPRWGAYHGDMNHES
jgi:hypothetical protein